MLPFLGLVMLLVGGTLAFVLWPLRASHGRGASETLSVYGSDAGGPLLTRAALLARREALYAALRDAEFDHAMGKLATEDYLALHRQLTLEAAQVLRQLDHLTPNPGAVDAYDQEIEQAVLRLREGKDVTSFSLSAELREAVEAEIAQLIKHSTVSDKSGEQTCPHCGQICQIGDRFCIYCGAKLEHEETRGTNRGELSDVYP